MKYSNPAPGDQRAWHYCGGQSGRELRKEGKKLGSDPWALPGTLRNGEGSLRPSTTQFLGRDHQHSTARSKELCLIKALWRVLEKPRTSGDRHFWTPCDVLLPSTFFSIFLSRLPSTLPLLSPSFPQHQLPLPYQGPAFLFLLSSSPRLSNGLWLTVPFVFSKPIRKLLAFPTDIWVARKVFMQQNHQTLFCLHHTV